MFNLIQPMIFLVILVYKAFANMKIDARTPVL